MKKKNNNFILKTISLTKEQNDILLKNSINIQNIINNYFEKLKGGL